MSEISASPDNEFLWLSNISHCNIGNEKLACPAKNYQSRAGGGLAVISFSDCVLETITAHIPELKLVGIGLWKLLLLTSDVYSKVRQQYLKAVLTTLPLDSR